MPEESAGVVDEAAPLRRDAERNRRRILAAAETAFADRGLEVSMDEIAARAEVGVGTVYRRFPSKEALIDALFEEKIAAVIAAAETAAAAADAFAGLMDFIWTAADMHARDLGLHQVLAAATACGERKFGIRARLMPPLAALVRRAREQGRLRSDFDVTDLEPIMVMANAVALQTRPAGAQVWRRHLQMLLDGLRADGPRTPLPAPAMTTRQLAALVDSPRHAGGSPSRPHPGDR